MDFVAFSSPSNPALNSWRAVINNEASIAGVPPCLLAAIIARETGGQNILQKGMTPGPGCGVGLTQITEGVLWSVISNPTLHGYSLLDPAQNCYVASAYFLSPLITSAAREQKNQPQAFNISCQGQIIYAVACGYNAGWGTVMSAMENSEDADHFTTNYYAHDVLAKYVAFVQESHNNA